MPSRAAAVVFAVAGLLASVPAGAQSAPAAGGPASKPSSPGPYVIDIRAAMSGIPSSSRFHPELPSTTLVPKRGFGLDAGAHVYPARLGPARVGFGVNVIRVRGTAATAAASSSTTTTATTTSTGALSAADPISVATTTTVVAPQVSFNFGTRDGWSYLGGGYGVARVHSAASGTVAGPLKGSATVVRDDGRAAAVNYGGGARWFVRDHVAVGFDLRFERIAADGTRPSAKFFVASVGVSVR